MTKFRIAVAPLLFLLPVCPTGRAQNPCGYNFPQDANPTPITSQDVCNFHQVDAGLYRGGRPHPSAYPKLVGLGIRTIISLEGPEPANQEHGMIDEFNRLLSPAQKIDFLSFPISPTEIDETGVSDERLRQLFQQIRDARRPIFIHCFHGKDRTGAIVALYRMRMNQLSQKEAYREAFHYKFSRADHGLSRTLDRYNSTRKIQTLPLPSPSR